MFKTIHIDRLKYLLKKKGIDLKDDKIFSDDLFDYYKIASNKIAVIFNKSEITTQQAYIFENLNLAKKFKVSYEYEGIINFDKIYFWRNRGLITEIFSKLPDINISIPTLFQYDVLKTISREELLIMTRTILSKKQKDSHLLEWIIIIGNFIIQKYDNTRWDLEERKINNETYNVPRIINNENLIWNIGDRCESLYFKWNKMNGISLETFYKSVIQTPISAKTT